MFGPSSPFTKLRPLMDGLNVAFVGWGLAATGFVVSEALHHIGFHVTGTWLHGITLGLFGGIGTFALFMGLAGYFNGEQGDE